MNGPIATARPAPPALRLHPTTLFPWEGKRVVGLDSVLNSEIASAFTDQI